MTLLWFLIFSNLIGGVIAAWAFIVKKQPNVGTLSSLVLSVKLPAGILILLISIINIFNFGSPHYPKLTLITGLLLGIVLSVDLIKYIISDKKTQDTIINIAHKIQITLGMIAIVIGLLWLVNLVFQGIFRIL